MASDTAMNDRAVERHDQQLAAEQQCSSCRGSGDCTPCGGFGYVLDHLGTATCTRCNGSGDCHRCDGEGIEP